jgi:hypothetical protein
MAALLGKEFIAHGRFRRDRAAASESTSEMVPHAWRRQNLWRRCAGPYGPHGRRAAVVSLLPQPCLGASARWADRLADSLRRTARWEDDCVTWPQSIGRHRPGRTALLVQHCHGAPGIVNCFADHGIDDLLIGAGELIWQSGPLRKGPGLCHGTAGNGFAFLKLFGRTGEQRWLDRARRFAMHAIEQHRRDTVKYGQRRYPLWTGEPGIAVYLSNCIAGTDRFPTMDNFFGP